MADLDRIVYAYLKKRGFKVGWGVRAIFACPYEEEMTQTYSLHLFFLLSRSLAISLSPSPTHSPDKDATEALERESQVESINQIVASVPVETGVSVQVAAVLRYWGERVQRN